MKLVFVKCYASLPLILIKDTLLYKGYIIKTGPLRYKQPTNKLKIRNLSEASIPYSIRHASFILIMGLRL